MKLFRVCAAVVLMLAVFAAQQSKAAPFSETVEFTQPNGQLIQVQGHGDEFFAIFETLDGYTVMFDVASKAYVYAELNADGSALVSTGVQVGQNRPAALPQHLRINQAAVVQQAKARQLIWEQRTGIRDRWDALKLERRTFESSLSEGPIAMAPPSHTTLGQITGLVLLIDFDDDEATIPRSEIFNYCNTTGYNGYGNNGSVRDYYHDVSNGMLDYTNVVTAYVRIPNSLHDKDYYLDPARGAGESASELIRDALDILMSEPDYETEVAPMIDQISLNDSGRALALNVFYAGGNGGVWARGLWPHMSSLFGSIQLTDRTAVSTYQITNIGNVLAIGTFCHENGHMICGYPDIYDYDYDSTGGAGSFCLMNSGGHGPNPAQVCAYLKYAAGWTTTVDVEAYTYVAASVASRMSHPDFNKIYRTVKPDVDTEYYLFEARSRVDRDASIPAAGLFIWHIDELGDRDNQSYEYNDEHLNYECALVQADGQHHFEKYSNSGDANDSWYAGNNAPGYSNVFKDTTTPSARWWDGSLSLLAIRNISPLGEVMTFDFIPPKPLMLSKPGALPFGREWATYSYSIGQVNGVGTMQWAVVSGSLPAGLTLGPTSGIISGMPTQATNAFFDVEVMTFYGISTTNSFSLQILPVHTIPYEENFDRNNGAIPDSWRQQYLTNTVAWGIAQSRDVAYPAASHSPTNMICLYANSADNHVTRLITPRIDFGEAARAGRFSFRHFMQKWNTSQDTLRVYYKTEMDGEWTLLATYLSSVTAWTERVIDLPSVSRSVYIAFEGNARYGHGVCLDTLKIWDPTPPFGFVTPNPLPNAIIDEYYLTTLQAEGGYEPYTYTIVSNSLPSGMTLSPSGTIYGTASTVQHVDVGIRVVDDQGQSLVATYALTVTEPVVNLFEEDFERGGQMPYGWTQEYINYTTSWVMNNGGYKYHPAAAFEGNYNAMLFAADRDPATGVYRTHTTRMISPQIDLGQAPENIKLYFWHCMESYDGDQDDVTVSYKNTVGGNWIDLATFAANTPAWTQRSILLPDPTSTYYISFKGSARFGYGICIDDIKITDESSSPVITTEKDLPDGLIGVDYEVQMAATGGVKPYTWDMAGGTLPDGLSLSSDGVLSGQPQEVFNGVFFVQVIGLDGYASTNRFNLKIRAAGGIPYFEDFENGGAIPEGWTQQIVSQNVNWKFASGTTCTAPSRQPVAAYSGSYNAVLFSTVSGVSSINKLISPMLNMGGGVTNATLTFRHHMEAYYSDQDKLHVYYRTSVDAPWQLLQSYVLNTSEWTERTIALPNPSSTYFIAFEGWAKYGYGICIDDVSVSGYVPSPYNDWLAEKFTEQEVLDGAITGYFDDPEGDLILNIWEYAFDLNPKVFDASGAPTGGVFNDFLQLSYRQNMDATDLEFIVEGCTDLVVGDWSTNDISEVIRTDMGGYWDVTTQHDVPVTNAPTRFMRLKLLVN